MELNKSQEVLLRGEVIQIFHEGGQRISVADLPSMAIALSLVVEASIPRVVEMVKTIVGSPGSRLESSRDRLKQDAASHA
jgi:hypothetical protein